MKNVMRSLLAPLLILMTFLFAMVAFGQTAPLAPGDFVTQVVNTLLGLGGASGWVIASAVLGLLMASMQVTVLQTWIWDKLPGVLQTFIPPVLGMIAGLLGLLGSGSPVSLGSVFTWATVGLGAAFTKQLLSDVAALPGVSPVAVSVITFLEGLLGGASSPASMTKKLELKAKMKAAGLG